MDPWIHGSAAGAAARAVAGAAAASLVLLLLLLLYVFYHVHTRVPSCNARKRMKLQEGAAYKNHLRETFE